MSATVTGRNAVDTRLFESLWYARAELAVREQDGITVTLFWVRGTQLLVVAVADWKNSHSFELVLEGDERPLDVFHHPYAYAASRGLDLGAIAREEGSLEETADV